MMNKVAGLKRGKKNTRQSSLSSTSSSSFTLARSFPLHFDSHSRCQRSCSLNLFSLALAFLFLALLGSDPPLAPGARVSSPRQRT